MFKICGECDRQYDADEGHCYCLDVSEVRFQLKMGNLMRAGDAYDCLESHDDAPESIIQQIYKEVAICQKREPSIK